MWSIQTPTASPGAVAVIQLLGESAAEIDGAMARLGLGTVPVGRIVLRDLLGVDTGLVARWEEKSAYLMPHGGSAVVRDLGAALERAGVSRAATADAGRVYPEAGSEVEAQMLRALARAVSPLAIDVLLDQPRRWQMGEARRSAEIMRLIEPPLVVAIGAANIGKSSLANALAGRQVAVVADEPGTTRDHVGVMIDMAGLVVRYVDTPGVRTGRDEIEEQAARLAWQVASKADLVLRCGDAGAGPVPGPAGVRSLVVALRTDAGVPAWGHDAAVSAREGTGLAELAQAIRDTLVPPAVLADPGAWRFWE